MNSYQSSKLLSITGTLMMSQVITAPPAVLPASANRPLRKQRSTSGPRTKSGQSFAEVPSPKKTPASQGRRFAQNQIAAIARTIASKSQLTVAVTKSAGERANIAASHGLLRLKD